METKITAQALRSANPGDTFVVRGGHPVMPKTLQVDYVLTLRSVELSGTAAQPQSTYTFDIAFRGTQMACIEAYLGHAKGSRIVWGV